MQAEFVQKTEQAAAVARYPVTLLLAPDLKRLPLPIQRYDEPFFPFGKRIIEATHDLVCAVMFDLASYMALGAAGIVALERTIAYARGAHTLTILHGPFAGARYARLTDENAFGVDAVTLTDSRFIEPYLQRSDRGVFVVRSGAPQTVDAPNDAGIFWQDVHVITLRGSRGVLRFDVVDEAVLYVGTGDDFAVQTRQALEQTFEQRSD